MRLSQIAINKIKDTVTNLAGDSAQVRLFGSRLDDNKKGGDIDLLISSPEPIENPAVLAATITARIIQALNGRKVDVLLTAPNLTKQTIHIMAEQEGLLL